MGTLRVGLLGRLLVAAIALGLAACGGAPHVPGDIRARALGFVESGRTALGGRVWAREASAGDLSLLEVVVGTDEVDAPLPLVITLHGYADAPRIPIGPYLALGRPYRIIAPAGPVEVALPPGVALPLAVGSGRAWSLVRVRDERPDELARDLDASVIRLSRLVETVRAVRPTRGAPVLVGYSQGGHLALALATRRPDLFGAVLSMAAWLPPALEPTTAPGRVAIHAIHARDDERVPYAASAAAYERLRARGWDVTLETIEGTHAVSPDIDAFVLRELERLLARE